MNPLRRSLASLAVLLIVSICAIGSLDYSHVTSETTDLGGGRYRTESRGGEPESVYQTTEGPQNAIGQPHGDDVEIRVGDFRIVGPLENGLRHGEFRYYDAMENFTGRIETYSQGVLVSSLPSAPQPSVDLPSTPEPRSATFQLIARDRPWFLFHLEAMGLSETDLDAFLEDLEFSLSTGGHRNRLEFSIQLEQAIGTAETNHPEAALLYRIFASIEAQNHLKSFALRRAVLDFYRGAGPGLYEILGESYPLFLSQLREFAVQEPQIRAFMDDLGSELVARGSVDPQSPLFLDQADNALEETVAVLDLEKHLQFSLVLPLLTGEMGAEVDPVYLALYEALPYTGPLVRVGETPGIHASLSNLTPFTAKSVSLTSRRATRVKAFLEVSNQGSLAEAIAVRGSKGDRFFETKYRGPSGNVTGAVLLGSYQTPVLDETTNGVSLRMEVIPNRRRLEVRHDRRIIYLQRRITLTVRALSTNDRSIGDDSSIRVQTRHEALRLRPQPNPSPSNSRANP